MLKSLCFFGLILFLFSCSGDPIKCGKMLAGDYCVTIINSSKHNIKDLTIVHTNGAVPFGNLLRHSELAISLSEKVDGNFHVVAIFQNNQKLESPEVQGKAGKHYVMVVSDNKVELK